MFKRRKFIKRLDIDPDEVLLDAFNLPSFDTDQFEGRVAKSIHGIVPGAIGLLVFFIFAIFLGQIWNLQIKRGEALALLSQKNRLDHEILFAERGVIYDRYKNELAWNVPNDGDDMYSLRQYLSVDGIGHVLGFLGYPEKDRDGFWWRSEYVGKAGIENSLNEILSGTNGVRLIEVDALNNIQSENTIRAPIDGRNVILTIDTEMQEALFKSIKNGARSAGFIGGAGIVMDVKTGEILALTSYPEYSPQVMSDGSDVEAISGYFLDYRNPFLNRVVLGEYTPGSIVKPYVAAAALAEKLVTPSTSFLSTGEIRIPNPYSPGNDSVFRDWKAHGWVNVREALSVSSNVYFYTVGGGFKDQKGLGIEKLSAYAARFGLGVQTGVEFSGEASGVVPTPAWKRQVFGEDNPWRLGNTYHTSIGQFGFLITPVQAVRYIASIANGGTLLSPHIIKGATVNSSPVGIDDQYLKIIREGMTQSAQTGVAASVNVPGIRMAGKTGTAQLGKSNQYMNSWVIGFWPADDPQFAYAVVLERAAAGTLQGAAPAMRSFFEWLVEYNPEYTSGNYPEE